MFRVFIYRWKLSKKYHFFRADISSSVYTDNKNKDILIFDEGPTKETKLTAAAKYPINFTESGKRFVLSLN